MAIHDFRTQLRWSEAGSDEPFWNTVYRRAFPNLVNHMPCTGDTTSQRMGIDRLIHLSNGRTLAIDEKKRSVDRSDILLEYLSNDQTNAPGWIEKDLAIDYLAYAFMPSQRVYLFDWCLLRRAWQAYGATWKRCFPHISAQNKGYTTHSVAVPLVLVCARLTSVMMIQLEVKA